MWTSSGVARVADRAAAQPLQTLYAAPGELAVRDLQDLMAYPFFSLGKSRRLEPIEYRSTGLSIRVEGAHEYGLATIWDADVLIWATSQLVHARDTGLPTSQRLAATPHAILTFLGRGRSLRDYVRLKAALDRLQATSVATSLRQHASRRLHRFSWLSEWTEHADGCGRPLGLELILPEWLYAGALESSLVLTLDRAYFALTGGIERWLYRLVRKHGGRQQSGWQFELSHLYRKSGSTSRYSDFAGDLRRLVVAQRFPGYRLALTHTRSRAEALVFFPCSSSDSWCRNGTVHNPVDH